MATARRLQGLVTPGGAGIFSHHSIAMTTAVVGCCASEFRLPHRGRGIDALIITLAQTDERCDDQSRSF